MPFHRQDDPQRTDSTPAVPMMGQKFDSGRPMRAKMPARGKVLCIFSDPDHIAEIEPKVTERGFSLLRAKPGIHGYWLAITSRPDLVITDVPEPGPRTDSAYLLDCLHRNPKTCDIPVVAILKATQQDRAETSGLQHASLCVNRDVEVADLLERADELIDSSKDRLRDKFRRSDRGHVNQVDAVFSELGGGMRSDSPHASASPVSSVRPDSTVSPTTPLLGPLRMPTNDSAPVS